MAKTLTANTLVRRPETGEIVLLAAGGQVPKWATDQVGEHLFADPDDSAQSSSPTVVTSTPSPEPTPAANGIPPKGGAGSGAPAWREYAASKDVEVADDASREDVWAALEKANVPTE